MPAPRHRKLAGIVRGVLLGIAALHLPQAATAAADEAQLAELGRRIYVDGILPDGKPLVALRFGGSSAARGAEAACAGCHRRSGYGSSEGRILVPPIAGAVLFAPGAFAPPPGGKHTTPAVVSAIERYRARPAYDEHSLQRTLRNGIDPAGVPLREPMARYRLDSKATRALAAYLRQLSAPAVGIDATTLHLATVIAPGTPPAQREALLQVLRAYAASRKDWGMAWRLQVWQLDGAPEQWPAQLEAWQRQQPVFALLSGIGAAEWQPVQRFCERHALACVLPSLELPPADSGARYSLYFSPGLALEARLLAQQLLAQVQPPRLLFQVADDDAGARAAAALQQALAHSGIEVHVTTPQQYAALPALPEHSAAVWWLRPAQVNALMAQRAAPPVLYLSAQLAPPEELAAPASWQDALRYVSLFDPLAAQRAQTTLLPWLARQKLDADQLRLRADAYAACNFFGTALSALQLQDARGIGGPLTQERLLEMLEANMTIYRDDAAPYYWQMSLGPAQRVLVKGGMLLRWSADGWMPATARIAP